MSFLTLGHLSVFAWLFIIARFTWGDLEVPKVSISSTTPEMIITRLPGVVCLVLKPKEKHRELRLGPSKAIKTTICHKMNGVSLYT